MYLSPFGSIYSGQQSFLLQAIKLLRQKRYYTGVLL